MTLTINAQLLRTIDEMQDEIDRLKAEVAQLNRNIVTIQPGQLVREAVALLAETEETVLNNYGRDW